MTVLDLIKGSLRLLNVLTESEAPSASESADSLLLLNDLVESWATERLMIPSESRAVYTFTAKSPLVIGPSGTGDITAPRPVELTRAGLVNVAQNSTTPAEIALQVLTDQDWAAVAVKGLTSTLPTKIFYDRNYPTGNLFLWPVPVLANALALYTPGYLSAFTGLTQTLALPPGYARALRYSLACELAPEFGRTPPAAVIQIALDAKANLKETNYEGDLLRCERAVLGAAGRFDWRSGEIR